MPTHLPPCPSSQLLFLHSLPCRADARALLRLPEELDEDCVPVFHDHALWRQMIQGGSHWVGVDRPHPDLLDLVYASPHHIGVAGHRWKMEVEWIYSQDDEDLCYEDVREAVGQDLSLLSARYRQNEVVVLEYLINYLFDGLRVSPHQVLGVTGDQGYVVPYLGYTQSLVSAQHSVLSYSVWKQGRYPS